MTKIINNYGENAGRVWKALETYGHLTQNKLMKTAKLHEDDFYAAIG